MGIFDAFVDDRGVRLIGVEAGGHGIAPGEHAARFAGGSSGVLQGTRSYVLQDADGNIELTHSISAGLDYAAVGPEHAWLHDRGRAEYAWIGRRRRRSRRSSGWAAKKGILPALESAHAIAHACRLAPTMPRDADPARQPVGPRRQGRAQRAEGARRRREAPMMSRLAPRFERARRAAGRGGLVAYVTAGDPDRATLRGGARRRRARPAPTSSRSACRSRIRSPTAR